MNTYPFDTLRDSFLRFLAEGMTHEEALEQFDEKEFTAAAMDELGGGTLQRICTTESILDVGSFVTNDARQLPALFEMLCTAHGERRNGVQGANYQQALELWQAGWTSESERPDAQVMSWYWRAPSKRPGKQGRKYLSTNQAFNAMRRNLSTGRGNV